MQRCATKSGRCVGAFTTLQTSEKLILKMIWMMNQVKVKWMCIVHSYYLPTSHNCLYQVSGPRTRLYHDSEAKYNCFWFFQHHYSRGIVAASFHGSQFREHQHAQLRSYRIAMMYFKEFIEISFFQNF